MCRPPIPSLSRRPVRACKWSDNGRGSQSAPSPLHPIPPLTSASPEGEFANVCNRHSGQVSRKLRFGLGEFPFEVGVTRPTSFLGANIQYREFLTGDGADVILYSLGRDDRRGGAAHLSSVRVTGISGRGR